jgi:nitroimidazol reductase NimA-like FMN-containing flavoprotein (pyridoxamine 5'-phosphate oxidase superfamily)
MGKRRITNKKTIDEIIKKAKVCRIGLSDNNMPYVVPLNFGYEDNCLYFHSSQQGKKIDILRKNNNVCFEVDVDVELVKAQKACKWDVKYHSVIGFGKAYFVEDLAEKRKAFDIIMAHYSRGAFDYPEKKLVKAALIRVEIESLSGKKSGY